MRTLALTLLFSTVALWSPSAAAQAEDQAAARALFNEARELMKEEHYDQACPKLEAASKLFNGSGVLLNLGDCYEHVGKTASAWSVFGEAASSAERSGRSADQSEALRRQSLLDSRLCKLLVRVNKETPDMVVSRDGVRLERAAWSIAIPVDPGSHVITAESPGRVPWSSTVTLAEAGKTVTADVPELPSVIAARPPGGVLGPPPVRAVETLPAPPPASSYWTGRRVGGVTIAAGGLLAVGVGGIVALAAKGKYDSATTKMGAARHDDSVSAVGLGNAASVVMAVGAAATAGGLILWLTASSAPVQVGFDGTQAFLRSEL